MALIHVHSYLISSFASAFFKEEDKHHGFKVAFQVYLRVCSTKSKTLIPDFSFINLCVLHLGLRTNQNHLVNLELICLIKFLHGEVMIGHCICLINSGPWFKLHDL